jgi:hypothetical protein
MDNIVAALERNGRVCQIQITRPKLEYVTHSAALQKPFPELTDLHLGIYVNMVKLVGLELEDEEPEPIPDSFLGGTALLEWRSISGITETTFVRNSPRQT